MSLRSASMLVALAAALANPATLEAQTPAQNDSAAAAAQKDSGLPLIPTRTLAYTATEGSWVSLDVSPDGTTILFELLGDLYTMPITGGEATRITSGMAYDMQPRYSNDGTRIAFVSDRNGSENLWVADADGSNAEALTRDERENYMSPEWAPEDDYLYALKGSQLWLYHTDGGSGAQVTGHREEGDPPPPAHLGPARDADDRYLWVNVRGSLTADAGFDAGVDADRAPLPFGPRHDAGGGIEVEQSTLRQVASFQVGRLDRETGRIEIRTHELFGAFRPVASPDGRWLVYATRHDARPALKLLDLETGDDRWLVLDVQRDDSQGGGSRDRDVYPGSAFTPDSRALITSWGGTIRRVEIPSGEVSEIPFSADVALEMGPLVQFDYPINDSTLTVSQIRGARPSPDGRRLAFSAVDKLWVGTVTEGDSVVVTDARRLTERAEVEHAPIWSPDGRWIAWVTWDDSVGGAIWRARADGGGAPERLTREAAFFDKIAYTRDGTRIMAVRGSRLHRMRTLEDFGGHGGATELEYVWLPAEGGPATRITWVGAGATQQGRNVPHVGPDPERMYVWAGSDGLLSMRFDGTDVRTVARVSGPPRTGTPDEVVLSPDGRRALVRAARNVYLVTVPPVGGTPPTLSVTGGATPAERLTDIGGDFVGWSADGSQAFWSIGRTFYAYDLAAADSVAAAIEAQEEAEAAAADEAEPDDPAVEPAPESPEPEAEEGEEDEDEGYRPRRIDVEIVLEKDRPRGAVVLRGARLITMDGDQVIENGDLVVRDNRIAAVGARGTVEVPADAEVIDVTGRTIMPGLVDIHAHTWVAWGVHRNQVSQFLAQLAYGVTTQRDPQTSSEDVLTYFDRMEIGELIGPRLYSTGPGVFGADNIGSLDDARDVLRRYADHFDTKTIKQYLAGDRKVRQWVIMAARELGLTPTTEGGSNFTMNLTLAQDGYAGLEHSLPIAPFFDDVVRLGAESQMTYTPTLIVAYGGPSGFQYWLTRENVDTVAKLRRFTPHDELDKWRQTTFYREDQYVHPLHAEQLVKWVEAGGRVGLGSHGELQGLGTHWELWMMASGGMDAHDALRAATLHSADAIGLDGDLGSLEAGKLADLIVLERNPLDDIRNTNTITHVMKNGRLYEGDTLDEVWPRQRALGAQWWWRLEPGGG